MTDRSALEAVTPVRAAETLRCAGAASEVVAVDRVRSGHTVFRIATVDRRYYLKTHSKDLEEFAEAATGAAAMVLREAAAYACLAAQGLPAVEVVAAEPSRDNQLSWPYLLTAELPGTSLRDLVETGHPRWPEAVEAFGAYLAAAHAIRFPRSGYLTSTEGPAADGSSQGNEVYHRPEAALPDALRDLERARPQLSPQTCADVERRLAELPRAITGEYHEPRFVHGNPHLNHPHLRVESGSVIFTGQIDMDGASAGAPFEDLHTVAWGMMAHAPRVRWWVPLFAGYGSRPDLERFRLALLSACFYCFGGRGSPPIEIVYRNLLGARTWAQLFTAHLM